MKKLKALVGNSQRLDGGAMFGNVPRALWSQWFEPDNSNCISLACRCLLIQEDQRNILLETGIGAFFAPKLKQRFGVVERHHVLLQSLADVGLTDKDIDIVILSHLHFDHAGGLLSAWEEGVEPELLFPNAKYLLSKKAWERAQNPHLRDRASFIPILNQLLQQSNRLQFIEERTSVLLGKDYYFHYSDGHTPGMMLTEIALPQGPLIFAADLIPGTAWVHLPMTMGYDRAPEQLINEKKLLLDDLLKRKGRLFYTHDPLVAMSNIDIDEKGRFTAVNLRQTC